MDETPKQYLDSEGLVALVGNIKKLLAKTDGNITSVADLLDSAILRVSKNESDIENTNDSLSVVSARVSAVEERRTPNSVDFVYITEDEWDNLTDNGTNYSRLLRNTSYKIIELIEGQETPDYPEEVRGMRFPLTFPIRFGGRKSGMSFPLSFPINF